MKQNKREYKIRQKRNTVYMHKYKQTNEVYTLYTAHLLYRVSIVK